MISGDIMSTLGDTKSTPGVYHDECGRYHKFSGGVQYTVEFHKYTGGYQDAHGWL